ncbi:hypothetical protein [Streptomyces canus]
MLTGSSLATGTVNRSRSQYAYGAADLVLHRHQQPLQGPRHS